MPQFLNTPYFGMGITLNRPRIMPDVYRIVQEHSPWKSNDPVTATERYRALVGVANAWQDDASSQVCSSDG